MANSNDQIIGRRRLVCAPRSAWGDGGLGGLGDDNETYRFNTLAHNQAGWIEDYLGNAIVFPIIDTDDYSLEIWFRHFPRPPYYRDLGVPVGFNGMIIGYRSAGGSNYNGMGFDGNNCFMSFGRGNPLGAGWVFEVFATPPQDGEWHHWCATYDRSGFAVFYIDGVSQGTVDISAQVATSVDGTTLRYVGTNRALEALGGDSHHMGLTGAWAFHRAVLTVAQIKDSVMGRRVQTLATTEGAWDLRVTYYLPPENAAFDDPETDASRIPQGWTRDVRETGLVSGSTFYLITPDLSGNSRHMGLRVPTWGHQVSFDPSWK